MATVKDFVLGARPKTLSAAIAPVVIGASLAWIYNYNGPRPEVDPDSNNLFCGGDIRLCTTPEGYHSYFSWWITALCLIVAIALQIGVNYANDYSDGKKGVDDNRVGPMRLVGSGRVSARSVLIATWISFCIAAIAGLTVSIQTTTWFVPAGAICIVLAWFYTGGKHPYGYLGFGEFVVFICFGFVATVGTFVANSNPALALRQGAPFTFSWQVVVAGCIPGLYSVAILLANNIRDIDTDRVAGKKTLPSRVGKNPAKALFACTFVLVVISTIVLAFSYPLVLIVVALEVVSGYSIVKKLFYADKPPEYISILVNTSKMNLVVGILIAIFAISSAVIFEGRAQYEPATPPINDTCIRC